MRDNHDKMPEIVDAQESGDHYFGFVQLERGDERRQFRFGISHAGYYAFRRVLQLRPFDTMAGVPYRYFFVPGARKLDDERAMMTVRVECGRDCKQMEIESPRDLVANLMWFYELDDWSKAGHLAVVAA